MKTLNLLFARPAKPGFLVKTALRFLFIALALPAAKIIRRGALLLFTDKL